MTGKFGTKEWSNASVNFGIGCRHNCTYCYAKILAARFNIVKGYNTHRLPTSGKWEDMELNLANLAPENLPAGKRVMFPTTHDLFEDHLPVIENLLWILLHNNNRVLVVSKPHFEVIQSLCDMMQFRHPEIKSRIEFRFSIGSTHSDILAKYEPNAPSFEERLRCLQYAYKKGFATSVSMEPFVSPPYETAEAVLPWVSTHVWIGPMNHTVPRELKVYYTAESLQSIHDLLLGEFPGKIRFKDAFQRILNIDAEGRKIHAAEE